MKKWLLILLGFITVLPAFCQDDLRDTSSVVEVRTFDKAAIKELKETKQFQYKMSEPVMTWWDRFWTWFWFKVEQILSTPGGTIAMWTGLVVFALAMIAFFVFKVMGMNGNALFGRRSAGPGDYTVLKDDINAISFDEAISEAIAGKNYRQATRLLYLQALKRLADRGYINWQINKTNSDYVQEVAAHAWQPVFKGLTNAFEFAWYGEAAIGQEHFRELQTRFQHFNQQT